LEEFSYDEYNIRTSILLEENYDYAYNYYYGTVNGTSIEISKEGKTHKMASNKKNYSKSLTQTIRAR